MLGKSLARIGHHADKDLDPFGDAEQHGRLTAAAIKVQHAFRLRAYVYRHFGPNLFVNSHGQSVGGRVLFDGVMEPAKWISVASSTSVPRLTRFMDHYWKMPKPEVLITVTGGAQDFQLTHQLQNAFDRGLVSAAKSAKAWIFTAGSDTGVMRLVGDAMHRFKVPLPVVGIFPWGVTNNRDQLAAGSASDSEEMPTGATKYTPSPPTKNGAPLNPHHTHFILVDNGTRGGAAWGSEIRMRSALEAHVARSKNIPIVQLVVQGGPGTLATVESTALAGKPIVVLSDSGGAAAALYKYCTLGLEAVEPRFHSLKAKLESIKNLNDAYGGRQLLFFSLDGQSEALDMSGALLEAVLRMLNQPSAIERLPKGTRVKDQTNEERGSGCVTAVKMTMEDRMGGSVNGSIEVTFDCGEVHEYSNEAVSKLCKDKLGPPLRNGSRRMSLVDAIAPKDGSTSSEDGTDHPMLARTLGLVVVWDRPALLQKVLASVQTEEPGALLEVSMAMQRAMELQREHVVKLFLELPGMTMHGLERLDVGSLYMKPDERKFLSGDRMLQKRLRLMLYERSDREASKSMHGLYQKALSRFFYSISPILRQELLAEEYTRPNDAFYWLTCHGNERMARDVWPHCENPVHAALLGATICMKMSTVIAQGQSTAEECGRRMQEWATGAIECAADEAQAHEVLLRSIREDRVLTALDIALRTGAKQFLFQRHCVSLMDRLWRGDHAGSLLCLPSGISTLRMTLYTLVPFLNPFFYATQHSGDANGEYKDKQDHSMLYAALGVALSIARAERQALSTATTAGQQAQAHSEISVARAAGKATATSRVSMDARSVTAAALNKLNTLAVTMKKNEEGFASKFVHTMDDSALSLWRRIGHYYSIPKVKFLVRTGFHVFNFVLYCWLIMHFQGPATVLRKLEECRNATWTEDFAGKAKGGGGDALANPPASPPSTPPTLCTMEGETAIPYLQHERHNPSFEAEIVWIVCEIGVWFDFRHQRMVRMKHNLTDTGTGTSFTQNLSSLLLIVALALRIVGEVQFAIEDHDEENFSHFQELYEWYINIVSLKVLLVGFQTMPFLSELYQPVGVLFIMLCEMVHDVFNWFTLFGVITLCFMITMTGFQRAGQITNSDDYPYSDRDDFTVDEAEEAFDVDAADAGLWLPLWALFGEFAPAQYSALASIVIWCYCLIGCVVLVNLLVAMFADTYARIKSEAEMEYVFLHCTRLFEYSHGIHAAPPVLNLPLVIWDLLLDMLDLFRWLCRCRWGRVAEAEANLTQVVEQLPSMRINRFRTNTYDKDSTPRRPARTTLLASATAQTADKASNKIPKASLSSCERSTSKTAAAKPGEMRRSSSTQQIAQIDERQLAERKRLQARKSKKMKEFDGRFMAQSYLALERKKEAETVQALAHTLLQDLHSSMKQRESEILSVSSRVGVIETALNPVQETLDTLVRLQTQPQSEKTARAVQRQQSELERREVETRKPARPVNTYRRSSPFSTTFFSDKFSDLHFSDLHFSDMVPSFLQSSGGGGPVSPRSGAGPEVPRWMRTGTRFGSEEI